jgi:hypothetical protein
MSTGAIQPFRAAGTVSLGCGVASTNVALAGGGESVVVTNIAPSVAYVRFGADATVMASSGDMPVLPNSRVALAVNPLITYAAGVLASGSGVVLFTRGDGSYL